MGLPVRTVPVALSAALSAQIVRFGVKPIKVKSDDGTFTILSVHAPKDDIGLGYIQRDSHSFCMSATEFARLRDAAAAAVEALETGR